jgi:trehalose 6-phosphate synthase/phosphatase
LRLPAKEIDTYDSLLREIKEAVSETNGRYGTLNWMPVWFFYRSFSQEQLVHLFRSSDVLLVTPLRDGMNLVAKEYIAARTDCRGMVVISETAGAASELAEAVIVNPNNYNAIAQGLKTALDMPEDEKRTRNQIMHRRLQRRHVGFWAEEFIGTLSRIAGDRIDKTPRVSLERNSEALNEAYRSAGNRILFLDYDGTLVGFKAMPEQARPDPELMSLLSVLTADPANTVVIISGRDRYILEEWFGSIDRLDLIASHGLWLRASARGEWTMTASLDNQWKESIRPILELYADRTPGSFVEEKGYSLAFHYRQCDPDMVDVKLRELRETLLAMTGSSTLMLQEGNKVLEVKDSRVNTGYIASLLIKRLPFDFVLGAGDDYTDEDLFCALPRGAYAVKVGIGRTSAGFSLKSWQSMRLLLWRFADISRNRR